MVPSDLAILKENLGFDKELIKEVINIYFNLYPSQIKNLKAAIEKSDYDGVKAYAHDIKGTVLNFGAKRAFELAYCIEQEGKNRNIGKNTKEKFIQLQHELKAIEIFLENFKI